MSANALFRPTFADLRAEIERRAAQQAPADEIAALVDQFLATGGDAPTPWVEYDGTVTWLYRDAHAQSVAVVGDIIGYEPDKTRLTRLPGCDLFARLLIRGIEGGTSRVRGRSSLLRSRSRALASSTSNRRFQ